MNEIAMNPVAMVHLLAATITALASVPMIQRKVKMNDWYGIRIQAAFESDGAWFDINHYGGRALLAWSLVVAAVALAGMFLPRQYWLPYNWTAAAIILGGLVAVMVMIHFYARRRKQSGSR